MLMYLHSLYLYFIFLSGEKMDPFYTLCKFVPEAQRTSASFASLMVLLKICFWEPCAPKSRPGPHRTGTIKLRRRRRVLLPFFLPATIAQTLINYSPNRTFPKGRTAAQKYF